MNGLVGVLLAAGRSRRMGTAKQLLPWKGGTVVSAAFDVISPHCGHMIVVLGHEAGRIRQSLLPRSFSEISADPDAEMIESIKAGVSAARSRPGCESVLLHPADLPATAAATVWRIILECERSPNLALMPQFNGKGGHPVLIPGNLLERILNTRGAGGLREFWRSQPELCRRIAVDDPGCVHDLDTPGDYHRACGDSQEFQ